MNLLNINEDSGLARDIITRACVLLEVPYFWLGYNSNIPIPKLDLEVRFGVSGGLSVQDAIPTLESIAGKLIPTT